MITGTALGSLVPTLTPGVAGCYGVEAPRWSPHLRPYPSTLPRLIMLDSVSQRTIKAMSRQLPRAEADRCLIP